MKSTRTLILFAGLAAAAATASASLIWSADFESYDTSDGAAALITNDSGRNDTFTSLTSNARMEDVASEVSTTDVPSFMTGQALRLSGTVAGDGLATLRLLQASLAHIGSNGVYVVSFDCLCPSNPIYSMSTTANTEDGGRSGSPLYSSLQKASALRATIVMNHTAGSIELPGSLGTVEADSMVLYFYDGSTYSQPKLSRGDLASNKISGFSIGISRSNFNTGEQPVVWLDNFGLWTSAQDTVSGVSVLELAPGIVAKAQ